MSAQDSLNQQQFLDLYHHTSPEAAQAIYATGRMKNIHNDSRQAAFFTTDPGSEYASAFGSGVVHARVPDHIAELDDEFPSGEQHYAVPLNKLRPEHLVRD